MTRLITLTGTESECSASGWPCYQRRAQSWTRGRRTRRRASLKRPARWRVQMWTHRLQIHQTWPQMASCGTRCSVWLAKHKHKHTWTPACLWFNGSSRIDLLSCRWVSQQHHTTFPVWRRTMEASTPVPDPTSTMAICITWALRWCWMFNQAVKHTGLTGAHACWSHSESDVPLLLLCRKNRAAGDTFTTPKRRLSRGFG